jgi:hypothetical protein
MPRLDKWFDAACARDVTRFIMKKNWLLITVAVVLAVVYAVYFTSWFKPKTIEIFHISRHLHQRFQRAGMLPSLIFGVNRPLQITEIEVVPLAEYRANQNTLPLWHLISDSNSVPVKTFFYGQFIRGLKPAVSGSFAQPLTHNVTYRLIVTAGRIKGEHDFELK